MAEVLPGIHKHSPQDLSNQLRRHVFIDGDLLGQHLIDTLHLREMRAPCSEEHSEEVDVPLQQSQHPIVGCRAAAGIGFQRPDVLHGQVRRSICPLLGLAALCLLVHGNLEDGEGGDPSMARVISILVAPSELQILHVAHKLLRHVHADRIPVVGSRSQELLQHDLYLHHRPPFSKEHCVDRWSAGVVVRRVQTARQANPFVLEGTKDLRLAPRIRSATEATYSTRWGDHSRA